MFVGHFHKYLLHRHHYNRIQRNYSALKFFTVPTFESLLCLAPFNHWSLMDSDLACYVIEIIQGTHFLRLLPPLSSMYLFSFLSLYMSMNLVFSTVNTVQLHECIRAYATFSLQLKKAMGQWRSWERHLLSRQGTCFLSLQPTMWKERTDSCRWPSDLHTDPTWHSQTLPQNNLVKLKNKGELRIYYLFEADLGDGCSLWDIPFSQVIGRWMPSG